MSATPVGAQTVPLPGPAEPPSRTPRVRTTISDEQAAARLRSAYPSYIAAFADGMLIWRDGERMRVDDGKGLKPAAAWLAAPDLKDIFRFTYPAGAAIEPPPKGHDPGRARPPALFDKIYGDCRKGDVTRHLVDVAWLPSRTRTTLKITRINGVAGKLAAISAELDALPRSFDKFLMPPAGTYSCRAVAGTTQASAHGYGIAIDIAIKPAHYWRWSQPNAASEPIWRNEIPDEIVQIFEKHGFIWGGRWHHFDTMHFEYRPELTNK